jgi:hypothetical protein
MDLLTHIKAIHAEPGPLTDGLGPEGNTRATTTATTAWRFWTTGSTAISSMASRIGGAARGQGQNPEHRYPTLDTGQSSKHISQCMLIHRLSILDWSRLRHNSNLLFSGTLTEIR